MEISQSASLITVEVGLVSDPSDNNGNYEFCSQHHNGSYRQICQSIDP
jgi:hypothetical protein